MKNKLVVCVCCLTFIILALSPTLVYAGITEEYYSYLSFKFSLTGPERSYTGQHMKLRLTDCTEYNPVDGINDTDFLVELQRRAVLGYYSKVGTTRALPKNGSDTEYWYNTGPGTYRFFFYKRHSNDDSLLVGNVIMSSYNPSGGGGGGGGEVINDTGTIGE